MLVHTPELMRCVVDVEHRRSLTDAQDIPDLPGRLTLHRPTQAFKLSRRQTGEVWLGDGRQKDSKGSVLSVNGKQLQVGDHSSDLSWIAGQGLVSVDTKEEVSALWKVKGHCNTGSIPESSLRFPFLS